MVARRRLRSSPTLPLAWLGSDTPVRVIEVESLRRSFGRLEAVKGVSFEGNEDESSLCYMRRGGRASAGCSAP